jgi:primary-amine oxidase
MPDRLPRCRTHWTRCPSRRFARSLRSCCASGGVDPPRWRFGVIELREPAKLALLAADGTPREALVTCWNREDGQTYKARVSLSDDCVLTWEHRAGEQANFTEDEFSECNRVLAREPRVAEALARYGIDDLDLVLFDTWAYGAHLVSEKYRGRRVGWTDVWVRDSESSNPYANPLSGLTFVVDMNTMELLEIEEVPVGERPKTMGEYVPELVPGQELRDDLRPLEIAQPEGVSFRVEGNSLEWQRWSMRLGSTRARDSSSTRSAMRRNAACVRSRTACPSPRWWCPTATPPPTTCAGPRSTSASGGSAS